MFYSSYVLAKKGALGRIWLAAHWDRKLTKAQIFQTDLEMAIKNIMNPEVPMALRMSGHLLLGVARIYARKVKYLLIDCNDALIKIKMAFKPGEAQIDLQPQEMVANYAAITLPETLGEFEITLPEITLEELPIPDEKDLVSVNIAKKREITLQLRGIDETREETQEVPVLDLLPDWELDPLLQPVEDDEELPGIETPLAGTPVVRTPLVELPPPPEQEEIPTFVPSTPEITPMHPEPIITEIPGVSPAITPVAEGILPSSVTPTIKVKSHIIKRPQIDSRTIIHSKVIKRQLEDVTNIIREPIPAPPTKKAMLRKQKELEGPEILLHKPIIEGLAPELVQLFERTMVTSGPAKDIELLPIESPIAPSSPVHIEIPEIEEEMEYPEFPITTTEQEREIEVETPQLPPPIQHEKIIETVTPIWSERTKRMHKFLSSSFGKEKMQLNYLEMIVEKKRNTVVGTFFELLVLKSRNIIDLQQEIPYGDIIIKKTPHFEEIFV